MVTELNEDNFNKTIKQGKAIVDFYADWCGPCQMMKPIFEKVSKEAKGVNFFKVNVDNCAETATLFAVRSIPTVVLFKEGKEVDRFLGLVSESDFKARINSAFK
jgi:thioredoxin 1